MQILNGTLTALTIFVLAGALNAGATSPLIRLDGDPANSNRCAAQWVVTIDESEACGCSVGYSLLGMNSPDCEDPCDYLGTLTKTCPGLVATTVTVPFDLICGDSDDLELICEPNTSPYLRARFYCAPCL
jgi:hypothetical protein